MSIQNLLARNQFNIFARSITSETDIFADDIITNSISLNLPSSGSTQMTFSGIWPGGVLVITHNIQFQIVNNEVTLTFPSFLSTADFAATITSAGFTPLPVNLRPISTPNQVFSIIVRDNGVDVFGRMTIYADGHIVIAAGSDETDLFTGAGISGLQPISVSYLLTIV